MLSPSKIIKENETMDTEAKGGTDLERKWSKETNIVTGLFQEMRREVSGKTEKLDKHDPRVIEQAATIIHSVQEEMRHVKTVVAAAELEIRTRLSNKRSSKPHQVLEEEEEDESDEGANLKSDETLPPFQQEDQLPPPADSEEYQNMIILGAQDTALLREAARIIRRKARELCEARASKEERQPSF
jgi:hypothetical protein